MVDEIKKSVAYKSVEEIENGMVVGIGTGTTAAYMIEALGKRVKEEALSVRCVPTSRASMQLGKEAGLSLVSLNEVSRVDITIDGADEVGPSFNGIKGGGGALLMEKIVSLNSDRVVWIVGEDKMVDQLGSFPLPVEVVRFGHEKLLQEFQALNWSPVLRMNEKKEPYLTDYQNYIIDLELEKKIDPVTIADEIKLMTGVVEHGVFIQEADRVIVGSKEGIEILDRAN